MTSHGQRNTLITLQRATPSQNGTGEEILSWGFYATEWVRVINGSGQERRQAAQTKAVQTATFNALANSKTRSLTPKDRISGYLGADWDITAVAQVSASEIDITATRST